jgi:hypothetical protein
MMSRMKSEGRAFSVVIVQAKVSAKMQIDNFSR